MMTVYLPSTHKFAIACGTAGAYVEVTDLVVFNEGDVVRDWGRTDQFQDTPPGTFSFTLDNRDGRFTPGNTGGYVVTSLTERMGVSWELGGQVRAGKIRSFQLIFPDVGKPETARVRITCDDMLGAPSRKEFREFPLEMVTAATPYLYWPLDDAPASAEASGMFGAPPLRQQLLPGYEGTVTFGEDGIFADSQVSLQTDSASDVLLTTGTDDPPPSDRFPVITYASGDYGSWGVWVTRLASAVDAPIAYAVHGLLLQVRLESTVGGTYRVNLAGGINRSPESSPVETGVPHYLAVSTVVSGTTATASFYMDGVFVGTAVKTLASVPSNADKQVTEVDLVVSDVGTYLFSHLSHTATRINEASIKSTTEDTRLESLAALLPEVTLAALPAALSERLVGDQPLDGKGALDAINDVIRTEQGYIYATTTGTLTAPSQSVVVRERTRPETVTATFPVNTDVIDAPDLVRDITNMVSTVVVNGTDLSVTVTDSDLEQRVSSANASASVLNVTDTDLVAWGEDRLLRGANDSIAVVSFTVDARSTATNRWADLLAMVPGNRYQVSALPSTQLGFSTWDGWLLGVSERHNQEHNYFTLYLQPVLEDTGVFDTDRFMADGILSLSSSINSAVTSISIATVSDRFTTTPGDFPIDIVIDAEEMQATACTGATPQVMTVVRGVNGTTAAAHSAGALVDLAEDSLFAF